MLNVLTTQDSILNSKNKIYLITLSTLLTGGEILSENVVAIGLPGRLCKLRWAPIETAEFNCGTVDDGRCNGPISGLEGTHGWFTLETGIWLCEALAHFWASDVGWDIFGNDWCCSLVLLSEPFLDRDTIFLLGAGFTGAQTFTTAKCKRGWDKDYA